MNGDTHCADSETGDVPRLQKVSLVERSFFSLPCSPGEAADVPSSQALLSLSLGPQFTAAAGKDGHQSFFQAFLAGVCVEVRLLIGRSRFGSVEQRMETNRAVSERAGAEVAAGCKQFESRGLN